MFKWLPSALWLVLRRREERRRHVFARTSSQLSCCLVQADMLGYRQQTHTYTWAARLYHAATLCVRCRWSVDGAEDGAARTRRGRSPVGVFVNRCGTLFDKQHAVAKTNAENLQPCGNAPGTQLCWCMPIAEP